MKQITLHGAAVRNSGAYVDAGETVDVGDKPDQIAADRAQELVRARGAVSHGEPATARTSPKPRSRKPKTKPAATKPTPAPEPAAEPSAPGSDKPAEPA